MGRSMSRWVRERLTANTPSMTRAMALKVETVWICVVVAVSHPISQTKTPFVVVHCPTLITIP
jgi:hypothetical protein